MTAFEPTELKQIEEMLLDKRPLPRGRFPEIELYMDQLLSIINSKLCPQLISDPLTQAKVNNYIKFQLVRRPEGKRYTSDHISELTILMFLKDILPLQECRQLFQLLGIREDSASVYDYFLEQTDQALTSAAERLQKADSAELGREILKLSLQSYALRRLALSLLELAPAEASEKK